LGALGYSPGTCKSLTLMSVLFLSILGKVSGDFAELAEAVTGAASPSPKKGFAVGSVETDVGIVETVLVALAGSLGACVMGAGAAIGTKGAGAAYSCVTGAGAMGS